MHVLHSSNAEPAVVRVQHFPKYGPQATRFGATTLRDDNMAYMSAHTTSPHGAARLGGFFAEIASRVARYRLYRKTFAELNRLSDRELADLGLSRSILRRTAYMAVYG